MFGWLKDPAEWRKFYAALVAMLVLLATYWKGDIFGKQVQEVLLVAEAVLTPIVVGLIPNKPG